MACERGHKRDAVSGRSDLIEQLKDNVETSPFAKRMERISEGLMELGIQVPSDQVLRRSLHGDAGAFGWIGDALTIKINEDWMITPDENRCGLISLSSDISLWSRIRLRWIRPMTVLEFHRMIQAWLGGELGIGFLDATEQGIFRMSAEVEKKVDRVFQLKNTWELDQAASKSLTRGPLLSADGTAIIVPARGRFASFVHWIDNSPLKKAVAFMLFVWLIADRLIGLAS